MRVEQICALVSDDEAIQFNRERLEKRKQFLLSLTLEERETEDRRQVVAVEKETGITAGVWSLEEVQEILEKHLDGWQDLIIPVKIQLAVERGLITPEEV